MSEQRATYGNQTKGGEKMLEIKIEPNNLLVDWTCWVCGSEFGLDMLTAVAYVDGEKVGDICSECLKGGVNEIKKQLLKKAARLQTLAQRTKRILEDDAVEAKKLAVGEIIVPEWKEFIEPLNKLN